MPMGCCSNGSAVAIVGIPTHAENLVVIIRDYSQVHNHLPVYPAGERGALFVHHMQCLFTNERKWAGVL